MSRKPNGRGMGRSKGTTLPIAPRFWPLINKTENCWLWLGPTEEPHPGYIRGAPSIGKDRPHRVSWKLHFGDIPKDLEVCHKCDNPLCVRPDHLFLGTHLENMQDAQNKNRLVGNKGQLFGELHPLSKLTIESVRSIRTRPYEQYSVLANEFNVSIATISDIQKGRTWNEPKHNLPAAPQLGIRRKINSVIADIIRESKKAGIELAAEYGISTTLVSQIKNNQAWKK
jgi:hypothetical protein